MFKYTIMIAAVVVVSASLANSVSANSSPTAANQYDPMFGAATSVHKDKQGHHGGGNLLESGLSGLFKSFNLKKVVKTALIVGAVVVLGAVAAAGAAGIAAIVTAVSAALPYFRFFSGGHKSHNGPKGGKSSDSEMDVIGEFVLGAFNKYDSQHKA
ncbi:uncharacterized protein LOC113550286 [Rhopalosiphum maidis]|uniref:uncharacterized protein LOC113550286 n=1 Tax=Rhopalosiphum maidis TaxID=43146 RepID=UPI000F002AD5|nr:uncharacterized protein LOC113550286 [Rhopalosiphum maidis]